jgi:hypothetical protein
MISKYLQKEDTPILERSRIENRLGHQAARFWPAEAEMWNLRKPASRGAIRFHRKRSATLMIAKLVKGLYPFAYSYSIERTASAAGQRNREHESFQLESIRV